MSHPVRHRNEDGQAIVLAVLGLFIIALAVTTTVNLGTRVRDRIALQNRVDEAAYSLAAMEARTFNFYAFVNRAQVSNYVSVMILQSWTTFLAWGVALLGDAEAFAAFAAAPNARVGADPCAVALTTDATNLATGQKVGTRLGFFTGLRPQTPFANLYDQYLGVRDGLRTALGEAMGHNQGLYAVALAMRAEMEAKLIDPAAVLGEGEVTAVPGAGQASLQRFQGAHLPVPLPGEAGFEAAFQEVAEIANASRTPRFVTDRRPQSLELGGDVARVLGTFPERTPPYTLVARKFGQTKMTAGQGLPADIPGGSGPNLVSDDPYYLGFEPRMGNALGNYTLNGTAFGVQDLHIQSAAGVPTPGKYSPGFHGGTNRLAPVETPTLDRRAALVTPGADNPERWIAASTSVGHFGVVDYDADACTWYRSPVYRATPGPTTTFAPAPFIRFAASKDQGTDFNQPSVWVQANSGGEPTPRQVSEVARRAGESWRDLAAGRRMQAVARALAYYHRPGNWREQPNFWNPYWGAKLAPVRAYAGGDLQEMAGYLTH
jgi:hypothetical protein